MYSTAVLNITIALILIGVWLVSPSYIIVIGLAELVPIFWCIPMVDSYSKKIKRREPVGVGFKICTLLFVNWVAGILMLCDRED